jgi:hypothetical protein
MRVERFEAPSIRRIHLSHVGGDGVDVLDGELEDDSFEVNQVFISLASPGAGLICSGLRRRGFYFGAVLPGWFGVDAMMMQKTPNHFSQIQILFGKNPKALQCDRT